MLTACGTGTEGEATPDDDTPATPAAESSPAGGNGAGEVPRVPNPVDVAPLEQDPCAALDDQQIDELNLEAGQPEELTDGEWICKYRYAADTNTVVSFVQSPTLTNGLSDVYDRKDAVVVFEPTDVAGHPAVVTQTHRDSRDQGYCDLQVGLTDSDVVTVVAQIAESNDDYPQGCAVAEVFAEEMIENLRGGA
ncbi:DUF3558 domain-containing protein [Saccharomonospora sp. CUA-673]|uniref:DUF3558 domain-containing protein n=1 Tax=Saccharomonospora sp. CUA-673 TaxID=1904969 RepID=UPI00210145EE|nr:DUF3558 domain-containing protein [Saccharomonospora sp. CUA-673]